MYMMYRKYQCLASLGEISTGVPRHPSILEGSVRNKSRGWRGYHVGATPSTSHATTTK